MDDRVSRWIMNWHRQHPEFSFRDRVIAALAGRLINWPDTLAILPYPTPFKEKVWTARLQEREAQGHKIFTGAYIINGALGGPKILQVTQKILSVVWQRKRSFPEQPETMQEVWQALNGMPGIGSFMAGQAVADLRHIHHELPWADRHTWAPQGPGSRRGVNRLLGRSPEAAIRSDEWLEVARAAYTQAGARLPLTFRRLELMDFQSVLCEFDKYSRLTKGEGSVRAKYRPHGDTP
jgi:hypothetical protein